MMETATTKPAPFRLDVSFLYRFSRVFVLAFLVILMALMSPAFLTKTNSINVLRQASLAAILALGETIVILTAGIDLSIGAVLTTSGIVAGTVLKIEGLPVWVGMLAGLGFGSLVGLVNGLMVAIVRLPPFIATYGTMWIATGLSVVFLRGYIIYDFDPKFRFIGKGYVFGIPMPIIIMAGMYVVFYFLMHRTTFGRAIYSLGANREAARLSGIKVESTLIKAYAISGFCAGLAGLLFVARLNAAEAGLGESLLLPVIAGIVLGGTSLLGGEGSIIGTLIGTLIMTIVFNGMNLLGISSVWQATVQGAIIIIAVLLDQWGRRAAARSEAGG
jgi:ribose transport system permease protein